MSHILIKFFQSIFGVWTAGPLTNKLQEAEVELIDRQTCNRVTWYNGIITEKMICAGLESGAADSCQVLILGFCFCFLLSHYGLVERKLHAVCVCFRVTAGARCSATARIRIGFIRLAWRASETSVDFLSSLGCTHESAFFQSGWLRVRQR